MVWIAFCSKGILKPIFVDKGVKINQDYYIKNVLKKFVKDVQLNYIKLY